MPTKPCSAVNAVLRIPEVKLTREALEAALGVRVDRFEASRTGGDVYAQLSVAETRGWDEVFVLMEKVGSSLKQLSLRGDIGQSELDVAFPISDRLASASLTIPNAAGSMVTKSGIDLVVSVYVTADDMDEL